MTLSTTAIYLSRQFAPEVAVSYVTGLGTDPQSEGIRKALLAEGVSVDAITQVPDKNPGLYMIENDESGERFFQYWRNDAAARQMFGRMVCCADCRFVGPVLIWSICQAITLAILDEEQRVALFEALEQVKEKVQVGFDPNYRPKLWPDDAICRTAFERVAGLCDYALVTLDDHVALWGDAEAQDAARQWQAFGAEEVIVKEGGANCLVLNEEGAVYIPPAALLKPKDTTGAGDSFAAGYLGRRALGGSREDAARIAHGVAGQVIMHPGAIIDKSVWRPVA